MSIERIDIENRVELATLELLKVHTNLVALVTAARIVVRRDTSHAADYPSCVVQAISFAEYGLRTGWYLGALQIAGMTYRDDDKSRAVLKAIVGEIRGWAQQTDLATQFNATAIALATATKLDVRSVWPEGPSVDATAEKIQEEFVSLAVVCRPTQATTT
jgi:hypothetical protein